MRKHSVPWLVLASLLLVAGCGGGRRTPAIGGAPPGGPTAADAPLQQLYEAGRYADVLQRVGEESTDPEALWYAAQSHLRLDQREDARRRFARIRSLDMSAGWQAAADLGLALIADDAAAIDAARSRAASLLDHPYAQFELGLASARRDDFATAAQAFDRCAEINPRFAYAYYKAALAYDRLNRSDLAVIRLEAFQRLAPQAPERPEVEALLRIVRAR